MNRRMVWALVVSYALSATLGIGSILYAGHIDSESNRQWCDLLVPLDERNERIPPQNTEAKRFAESIHNLRSNFEC